MARKRANAEHENLTDSNIEKVIGLLSAEKPITKKAACEILRINYNTTRLDSIINSYKDKKDHERLQREKKRYKAASKEEIDLIVTSYLEGEPVSKIANSIYRSDNFVKNILERVSCPKRIQGADYWTPELIPEAAMREKFEVNEHVWSARYNSMAIIKSLVPNQPEVYRVWLDAEEWQQFAYQPYWELASLDHLRQQGITL